MTWTPGHRRVPPGLRRTVSEHMIALASLEKISIKVFGNKPTAPKTDLEEDIPVEVGEDIILAMDRNNSKLVVNLSSLTTAELEAFSQIVNLAIEDARIVVKDRDRIAEEAMASGDAIFYRSLRGDPKVTVFRRTERPHDPGVHGGHQDAVAGGETPVGDQPG